MRVLRQIGLDNSVKHLAANRAILRDFYVDNLLTGAFNTVWKRTTAIKKEIDTFLQFFELKLRKWTSNESQLSKIIWTSFHSPQTEKDLRMLDEWSMLGISIGSFNYWDKWSTNFWNYEADIRSSWFDGSCSSFCEATNSDILAIAIAWDESVPQTIYNKF